MHLIDVGDARLIQNRVNNNDRNEKTIKDKTLNES